MAKELQVRLEVVDGFVWVTVYDGDGLRQGDWDEFLSAKLDNVMKTPNALYDIAALAYEGSKADLTNLFSLIG